MRILDDKGRLFGTVNLIDLAVLILILSFAASFVVNVFSGFSKKINEKENVQIEIKVLYPAVPSDVLKDPKVLRSGDTFLVGKAVIEKVLEVKPVLDLDHGNVDTGFCKVTVLVKANCVRLNQEYYCANMPVKVNSVFDIINPMYEFRGGTILSMSIINHE